MGAAALIDPICFLLADGAVLNNFLYSSPDCPLHEAPQLLKKGLTRPPSQENLLELVRDAEKVVEPLSWFKYVQRYLVANEPTMQDCFRRGFWWAQHWLHPSELPSDTLVLLSGNDSVADAPTVHAYLKSWQAKEQAKADLVRDPVLGVQPNKLQVQLRESWGHGWLMLHPSEQRSLVLQVQTMHRDSSFRRRQPHPRTSVAATAAAATAAAAGEQTTKRPLTPNTPRSITSDAAALTPLHLLPESLPVQSPDRTPSSQEVFAEEAAQGLRRRRVRRSVSFEDSSCDDGGERSSETASLASSSDSHAW